VSNDVNARGRGEGEERKTVTSATFSAPKEKRKTRRGGDMSTSFSSALLPSGKKRKKKVSETYMASIKKGNGRGGERRKRSAGFISHVRSRGKRKGGGKRGTKTR